MLNRFLKRLSTLVFVIVSGYVMLLVACYSIEYAFLVFNTKVDDEIF